MIAAVRPPVLNVMDAIWVSHKALGGYPASSTFRANQLLASQDPVALDAWSARNVLFPVDSNPRHSPDYPGVDRWLTDCHEPRQLAGRHLAPDQGIHVGQLTKFEVGIPRGVGPSSPDGSGIVQAPRWCLPPLCLTRRDR